MELSGFIFRPFDHDDNDDGNLELPSDDADDDAWDEIILPSDEEVSDGGDPIKVQLPESDGLVEKTAQYILHVIFVHRRVCEFYGNLFRLGAG